MRFNEIEVGQKAFLEVVYGDASFELSTSILGKNDNGLLIKPYKYQGTVLAFERFKKYHTVFFHLHIIDSQTGNRIAFKNLDLTAMEYNGQVYYRVVPRHFLSTEAVSTERRRDSRISLEGCVAVVVDTEGACFDVDLVDISEAGVSFQTAEKLKISHGTFHVAFSDVAGGKNFNLNVACAQVRVVKKENCKFYGCRYVGVDQKLLPYLYFKHSERDYERNNI